MDMRQHNHCMVVHARYPVGEPRVEREADTLIKQGFTVDVICLRHPDEPKFEVVDGINVYRLPVRRHKDKGVVVQLFEYLSFLFYAFWRLAFPPRRYQSVQLHGPPDFLVFAALIPRLRGAKVILDIHDLMPEFYMARFKSDENIFVRILKLQERLACGFAHHVITVTEPWRQTLVRRGVAEAKTSVVMNVPGDRFEQGNELPPPPPDDSTELRLIYHGNITERYGLDMVAQALPKVLEKAPNLQWIIHGRGDYLPAFEQLLADLGLTDYVKITTHFIPTEELSGFIRSAHVGLVPYRNDVFTDGILPTKMMEYTKVGLPVIAAKTTAIQAYFDDDMAKFFTPENIDELAAAIEDMYTNRAQLTTLRQNLQRFNQTYNWPKQAESYVNTLRTLVEDATTS